MKTMTFLTTAFLFLQLLPSCKKEKAIEPKITSPIVEETYNKDFELVWSVRDSRGFTSYGTVVTPNSVIFFIDPPGTGGDDIIALDKTNGDTLWIKKAQGSTSKHTLVGNTICYEGAGLFCLDVSTGNQLWKINNWSKFHLDDFIYANNKIYAFYDLGGGIAGDSTKLYEIDYTTGVKTGKFTIYGRDRQGYNQVPKGMVYWKHPNGNDIIFTQSIGYINLPRERGDYFAIDITGDSMYWDLGDFYNIQGIGSNPIILNNTIFFNGPWSQHTSINMISKTIEWTSQVPSSFRTGLGIMQELNGKIFQSLGNASNFNIINTSDGTFYKNYSNLGSDNWAPGMKKYNNHIYFTSSKGFYKMDGNGSIVKQLLTRNDRIAKTNIGGTVQTVGGTIQTVDIDPSTGYIYATVGYNLVCMKEK